MYKKNKAGIPIIDFKYTTIKEFSSILGHKNYNMIYHNYNNFVNRTRMIDSKLYGIYMNYIIH
jgi:hypothetical protein